MATRPMRVLLVEDDPAYSALLTAELDRSAVEVEIVRCLSGARTKLASQRFDAILLDLGLPDSAGLETVEAMHGAAGETPIVVLTSSADDGLSVLAMQRGAQDYLIKSDADAPILVRALRYARERAAFRQSIRNRETRFRALVEHSYDAVTLVDEQFRVLYDSRSIESVCGYTPEERLGNPIQHLLHPDDIPAVVERLTELQQAARPLTFEYRFKHKDGSWRWGEAVAVNHLGDPAIHAIVINHRDVSERKAVENALRHSEEQLRQAQKLEAIGRLAGGIAHDFNNVLTAIFGYTDLLLDDLQDDPRRADVEEIRRSAERAAALTRQLLAFSRKQVMQPRLLDVNDVIRSVAKLLARLVGDDVVVDLRLAEDLVPVRADPGQLEQVLMNLVANARDAMPEGGHVTVSTRTEHHPDASPSRPGLPPGEYAVLTVTDTGMGIPPEARPHIFEPFFTTKEQGKGTGLGLATVYGIVKQTGGGVYLDVEEGQPTTFLVYLPAAG